MADPLLAALLDGRVRSVRVGAEALTGTQLLAAASEVAGRVAGCPMAAVPAATSLETVVSVVGCLLAGVPLVPVPPDSGSAGRAHVLRDSGAALWLGEAVPGVDLPGPGPPGALSGAAEPAPAAVPADTAAMVMYTSGTTGPPKGVVLSRRAIAAGLDALADAWGWTADDVVVHGLPLFHVHGLILGVLGSLRIGGSLVHPGGPDPWGYAEAASTHGGSLFFAVPTIWGRISADASVARRLAAARLLVSGSAALPAGVARDLAQLTGQVPVERYGMTETLITLAARADQPRRVGWVGGPVAGVEARVVDDAGDPVPPDGQGLGDLQVRGATLFDGYLGLPEVTGESWTGDGWFRTGDVAAVDLDGWYKIVGRKSADLIKSGGYRVGAGEIESCLLDHPGVAQAAVIGVPDDDLGQRIVAYVVRPGGVTTGAADLIEHVATELSAHKRPREVRFVASLPRNDMGKVVKSMLN
ncbi:MAG TPA: AMP-binding protein [Dermatophilaceae bacterium]|nr:AMP-binding protein [Dermatophilaceae bacterium]